MQETTAVPTETAQPAESRDQAMSDFFSVDPDVAEQVDASGDEGGELVDETAEALESHEKGEKPSKKIDFDFLKDSVVAKKRELEAKLQEYEAKLQELEPKAKKADMKLRDLLDEFEIDGKLSREEMVELAQRLIYQLDPEKIDPEVKADVEKRKAARERAKVEERIAKAQEEYEKLKQESVIQATLAEYKAEVKYATKALHEFPAVESFYEGNREQLQADIFEAAQILVAEGVVSSDDEISPEHILALMEKEIAEKTGRVSQKRTARSSTSPSKSRPIPASSHSDDDREEEMHRFFE